MFELALSQGLFKLFLALIGIMLGRLSLVWMDKLYVKNNSKFGEWFNKADPLSIALYYVGRLLFVGIIIGSAIG